MPYLLRLNTLPKFTALFVVFATSLMSGFAQEAVIEKKATKEQVAVSPKSEHAEILKRIELLKAKQAEYLKKLAAGKIKPNQDLVVKWPKIQQDVFLLRSHVSKLGQLEAGSPVHAELTGKIFSLLGVVGRYLDTPGHPKYDPPVLSKAQVAEMKRIEKAMANLKAVQRSKAKPVKLNADIPPFTLINLPLPLVFETRPGAKLYLSARAGGVFSNELSLIELTADDKGIARTTWLSIGDAVADCEIVARSVVSVEPQYFTIRVVMPSLLPLAGLPAPDPKLLSEHSKKILKITGKAANTELPK